MSNENSKNAFPKIPESNWWSIRQQFKKTIPNVVNISYLKSLLNLSTDQSAVNLISPLKTFGLIDESGKPTERANEWRDDEKYASVCQEIVKEVYPIELMDLYPDSQDLDKPNISNWFMAKSKIGQSAASLIAATFILLRNGNVNTEKSTKKTKVNSIGSTKKKIQVEPQAKVDNAPTLKSSQIEKSKNNLSMHIDLQIHISPEASAEQIDSIFSSISKHLYK